MAFRPRTCVAIDLGTAATGYCLAISSGNDVGSAMSARCLPFKPGDRASQATEKNLTAILLNAATMKAVAFGREARRRFNEMDQGEMKEHIFLSQFKMAMSPTVRGNTPLTQRTVHGEGADVAVPLLTAVSKVLAFIREEAEDRVRSIGIETETLGWVLTVPAIWDEPAKAFMRLAAVEAGLIEDIDSDRLQLALEPEGAVISSAMDAPPELRSKLTIGQRLMILDCGGGTVDVTVSELLGSDPPKLKEILPPSGGSWGGTLVDAEFRKFCNTLLFPDGQAGAPSHSDAAAASAALDAWEAAKCGWDPAETGRDKVIVSGLATVCENVGGVDEMQKRVTRYNEANNLLGAEAIVYRPRSFSLILPAGIVKKFFDACIEPICGHMQKLLIDAAEMRKSIGFIFLVGGFAESLYLQRSVRDALTTESGAMAAHLIIPAKPVQCVNRGAAVWGLYPNSFIVSRVSKYTLAVALCERYNPVLHDPVPHPSYLIVNSSGTWVNNVLVPLVQRNDNVPVDMEVTQEVAPVRDGQTNVNFVLYKVDRRLPPMGPATARTFVITKTVADAAPPRMLEAHVPESAGVATVSVLVGGGASINTRATLSLFFGRTEIAATAHSKTTGDRRATKISWASGDKQPELRA